MQNSLYPAAVKINYQSPYSIHTMTLPSVAYNDPVSGQPTGSFQLRGAALPTAAGPAVTAFVNLMKAFFKPGVTFVDYTIFTYDTPTSPATPKFTGALGIAGTSVQTASDKAVQKTSTFRCDDFSLFKLVFLDSPAADFNLFRNSPADPAWTALIDYVTADVTWLASRKGGRPVTFLQSAATLNEKLRRSYKMT
jgi:hypothetical protein